MKTLLKLMQKINAFFEKHFKGWLMKSNRPLHILICLVGSAICGYGFGLGAGFAAEAKDVAWGGSWDWKDICADLIGTAAGTIIYFLLYK